MHRFCVVNRASQPLLEAERVAARRASDWPAFQALYWSTQSVYTSPMQRAPTPEQAGTFLHAGGEAAPSVLKTTLSIVLGSPAPLLLLWGPSLAVFYNDASRPLVVAGDTSPLGREAAEVWPEAWPTLAARLQAVLRGDQANPTSELVLPTADGGGTMTFSVGPVRDESGQILGLLLVGRGERTHSELAWRAFEERQSFLLGLTDRLRPLEDAATIEREATRMLGEELGANRVFYATIEMDDDTAVVHSDYVNGMPSGIGRYSLTAFAPPLVPEWRAGRTTVMSDVDADPRLNDAHRAAFASVSARAVLALPLVKGGRFVALLGVNQSQPRAWTAAEIRLTEETAERTWAAVERARAEERALALLAEANFARAEAESANRAKDEFLATLGHELRTPLAAILLWSGVLRSGAVPLSDIARAVDAIAQSAASQARLIDDLLDLSRLKAGKLTLDPAPTDVARVVHEAVEMVAPMMTVKQLRLEVAVDAELGVALLDGNRLKQVLSNLLSNAVKFTSAQGWVTLRARKHDGQLEVEVADTGVGIDPALIPRLFERFWQADMAETRKHGGLGIGLALAQQLVHLHGGTIEGTSAGLGRGATFRIRLPWITAVQAPTSDPEAAATVAPPPPPLKDVVVLLVEDDAPTRDALAWVLSRAHATVMTAGTAAEAMAALNDKKIDILVSDLGLPDVSGFELIALINDAYLKRGEPAPPACAVSAHARDVDRIRALDAGFDMFLTKPITGKRLLEAVTDLRDVSSSRA